MRGRLWIGLVVGMAAMAALPPAAQAKGELTAARLCGASGCVPVSTAIDLRGLSGAIFRAEQRPSRTVPLLQPYFRLRPTPRWAVPNGEAFYLPAAGTIETGGQWARVGRKVSTRLNRLVAGRAPLEPVGMHVLVHGKTLSSATAANALLGTLARVRPPEAIWGSPLLRVVIWSRPDSPWTDQWIAVPMTYAPRYGLIEVGYGLRWFRVPSVVDRRMRAALGLRLAAASSPADGGPPVALLAAAAGVAVLLGVVSLSLRRRRGWPARA